MGRCLAAALLILSISGMAGAQSAPKRSRRADPAVKRDQAMPLSTDNSRLAYSIDDVLWWLPEDTETVQVARGPFKVNAVELPPDVRPLEYVTGALRSLPFGMFRTIKQGTLYKHLHGQRVLFTVEGSRRFSEPKSLGVMLYEGCSIIILEQDLVRDGSALIAEMRSKAKQVQRIAGHPVALFEEKLEEDIWTILIAVPAPNVVLCATNQDYLTRVLNRMQQKGQQRALPETLPEWKQVNTEVSFWAVRHYDPSNAERDSTSPLSGLEKAANWPDKQAVGIVFELDPDKSKTAVVRYLSANKDALKIFSDEQKKASYPGQDFKPIFRQMEPGVVEMQVSLDDRETGIFLLVLIALLGHAVYV